MSIGVWTGNGARYERPSDHPYTPIYKRYRSTKALRSDPQRLQNAEAMVADPVTVAEEFAASVALLEQRYDSTDAFRPKPKRPRPPVTPGTIVEDHDLSWYCMNQQTIPVVGQPERSARYVNYQMSIIRTTGRATFDDEKASPAGRALMDLLVAEDGTPIACEARLKRDEPFSGLIQLLAYLAHLSETHASWLQTTPPPP